MVSLLCRILKNKQTTELIDREKRLIVARGGEWGFGKMGIKRYKLPAII